MKKPFRPSGLAVTAASCVAIFLPGSMVFGFPGVMGTYWQQAFSVGKADVGRTLFFVLAAVGLFFFVVGRLQEKFGTIRVTAAGAVLHGGAMILVGHADGIGSVYLWAFLTGVSSACIYVPTITAVQRWIPARKGLVSGLVSMFFGLAGAVMTPVFRRLLTLLGYADMTLLVGIGALLVGLAASLFIRLPEDVSSGPAPAKKDTAPWLSLNASQSLRTRSFWVLWITFAFVGAAGISMVTLSAGYGVARGLPVEEALLLLMAFNLTNGVSRLVSGFLSDVMGRRLIMSLSFFLAALSYFLLPYLPGPGFWALLAAVIGFAFGTLFAVSAPLVGDCFGMEHFGPIFGLVFTAFGFLSGALGPWFTGFLLDATGGDYTLVFAYLGTLLLLSSVLIWTTTRHTECTF